MVQVSRDTCFVFPLIALMNSGDKGSDCIDNGLTLLCFDASLVLDLDASDMHNLLTSSVKINTITNPSTIHAIDPNIFMQIRIHFY
jgi:hypothetical protein